MEASWHGRSGCRSEPSHSRTGLLDRGRRKGPFPAHLVAHESSEDTPEREHGDQIGDGPQAYVKPSVGTGDEDSKPIRVCINTRRAPSTRGGAHDPRAIPSFALTPTYVSLVEQALDSVEPMTTRCDFVRTIPMGAVTALSLRSLKTPPGLTHPDPRPGLDTSGGAHVEPAGRLP